MSKLSSERIEFPIRDICNYKFIQKPYMIYTLIIIMIMAFCLQIFYLEDNGLFFMLHWNNVISGQYWRLITHIFLHAGILHLCGNLWFLYLFGDNVEDWFGRNKYLRIMFIPMFLIWGVIAGISFAVMYPNLFCLGASGAISGVMGFYFIMYPYAQIDIISLKAISISKWEDLQKIWESKIIYPVSAFYFLWGWFAIQFISWYYFSGEPIAYLAHIVGFMVGAITAVICKIIIKEKISSEFISKLIIAVKDLIKKIRIRG